MAKKENILRVNLIIKRLEKSAASFKEIEAYLQKNFELDGYELKFSKRTFQRDIEEILSIYDIEIEYNFSDRKYCIKEKDDSNSNRRMLEAFDLFHALKVGQNISQKIYFENRKSNGSQYLLILLQAIKNKNLVSIEYEKFSTDSIISRVLIPLAIKESRGRWYLVAKNESENKIKTFGLDRIHDIEILKRKHHEPDFDCNKYFEHCFGIIKPESDWQNIKISFSALQGKYIKSYPLHHSQKLIGETSKEIVITLQLYITFDFLQELMSFGNTFNVIEPLSLKHELIEISESMIQQLY